MRTLSELSPTASVKEGLEGLRIVSLRDEGASGGALRAGVKIKKKYFFIPPLAGMT